MYLQEDTNMIIVIVPTRTRPESVTPLIESFVDTADTTEVCLYLVVDGSNDPKARAGEYVREAEKWGRTVHLQPERLGLVGTLNRVVETLTTSGGIKPTDIISMMGDDHRPRTPGWARQVTQAIESGADLVWCADGIQGGNLATAPFLPAKLVIERGWFAPKIFHHYYWDQWLTENSKNSCYLDNYIIEHCHPISGKVNTDTLYNETMQLWWEKDKEAFETMKIQSKGI